MKATKISAAIILYCEVSRKYLDEIAFGLAKFKKLSWEQFCNLCKSERD